MISLSSSLFGLVILSQVVGFCASKKAENRSDIQISPSQGAGSIGKQELYNEVPENQHVQSGVASAAIPTNARSKRDSGEMDEERYENKRLRDFVGKRSSSTRYLSLPHLDLVVPADVTDNLVNTISASEDFLGDDNALSAAENRDIADLMWTPRLDKRLRDFVGKRSGKANTKLLHSYSKRLRDFVGKKNVRVDKRLRDFLGKRSYGLYEDKIENEKRLRDFLGKRSYSYPEDMWDEMGDEYTSHVDKRPREFLGKRSEVTRYDNMKKRIRDFVGKRTLPYLEIPSANIQKRLRDFVGKRDSSDMFETNIETAGDRNEKELFHENKRIREFIGKRNAESQRSLGTQLLSSESGHRLQIQKKLRDFIGKRTSGGELEEIKRLRDFVGKRSLDGELEEIKRLRDFVGKRSLDGEFEETKRLRDFVGKRSTDGELEEVKRLRDFVGKRSLERDFEETKRLRDFVGKRSSGGQFEEMKRLRDFVGKRSLDGEFEETKRLRDFVGKRSSGGEFEEVKRLRDFIGKRSEVREVRKRSLVPVMVREFVGNR